MIEQNITIPLTEYIDIITNNTAEINIKMGVIVGLIIALYFLLLWVAIVNSNYKTYLVKTGQFQKYYDWKNSRRNKQ